MLGSEIITNALYNIYGETPAPETVTTRAAKELYDILIKVQRTKKWWFSRAEAVYAVTAGANTIDLDPLGMSMMEIDELMCTPLNEYEYELKRFKEEDVPDIASSGHPAIYWEDFVDYSSHNLYLYPTPDVDVSCELVYRKMYVPSTGYAGMAAYGSTSAEGKYILDILDQYLEALLTSRLCIVLDYAEKAATYAQIALDELENLTRQNWDYNRQGFQFIYKGI